MILTFFAKGLLMSRQPAQEVGNNLSLVPKKVDSNAVIFFINAITRESRCLFRIRCEH